MIGLTSTLGCLAAAVAAQSDGTFWLPPPASTMAPEVDRVFYFIFWVSVFFFVLIVGLMVLFVLRYRQRPGHRVQPSPSHNTPLELTWTIIPLILVIVIFYMGFRGFMNLAQAPQNAYEILVTASRWQWDFTYPNGHVNPELHVEAGTPVRLVMSSQDVIHSFFIPDFRVKRDVVPGRYNTLWFEAKEPGEHLVLCAEYCGTAHSDMLTKVVVHPRGEFAVWLENADPINQLTEEQYEQWLADPAAFLAENPDFERLQSPAEFGERLFVSRGCAQCHSVDGTSGIGPSVKGIYGHEQPIKGGPPVLVDENYIRESILEPNAKIVLGYEPVMPTFQGRLKDREITALIEYIKSLAE